MTTIDSANTGYSAWLAYRPLAEAVLEKERYIAWCKQINACENDERIQAAVEELMSGITSMTGVKPEVSSDASTTAKGIILGTIEGNAAVAELLGDKQLAHDRDGYIIRTLNNESILIAAHTGADVLRGAFHLLRLLGTGAAWSGLDIKEQATNDLRMINQWDDMNGSVERGYAGSSIFFRQNEFISDKKRVLDYARLLASVGINAISINNVNVHLVETKLITDHFLPEVMEVARIFGRYGIKLYLSVNYASPIELGDLTTADPLDPAVKEWWKKKTAEVYKAIPDFGGYLVKADSENRPGPFTYNRDHADGANMLAEALEPHGGIVIWRCFVYDCKQDWRDRKTDRARAAYDHFKPLDGRFMDNVILQIKNGPMDFQVREPVSPLFGAMSETNQVIEFQIAQEYTGQQRHVCYLIPQWKEVLDFPTYACDSDTPVKRIVDGTTFKRKLSGFAAVSNIGDDRNWTGHLLAQANLFGYGRLAWNPELTSEEIAREWTGLALGNEQKVLDVVTGILLDSLDIYESYTAPLGVGWMVNPNHHYGPNVDGYEYDKWGTYHFADRDGVGVDRTVQSGTGYAGQYQGKNAEAYESVEACPDELLLFFHHVPYTHVLHSGITVIQHIYNTHFEGAERAAELVTSWESIKDQLAEGLYEQVLERLLEQREHSKEWRDRINTYFLRKSGISDEKGRTIY